MNMNMMPNMFGMMPPPNFGLPPNLGPGMVPPMPGMMQQQRNFAVPPRGVQAAKPSLREAVQKIKDRLPDFQKLRGVL